MAVPEAFAVLKVKAPFVPELVIVLGSGLGALADSAEGRAGLSIPFGDLPGFPTPTVAGHDGKVVFCEFESRRVLLQSGRFHFYEGYPMPLVVMPMRLYGRLGVRAVLLTNAAGALNPAFGVGDLMALSDHINFFGTNPLIGPNLEPGPRFPDMTAVYDSAFRNQLQTCAQRLGQTLHEGVYLGLSGPSYETPAEIRAFRTLGADAVGMSTVPEAIVARHEGMRVAGISCLCNMAAGILPRALTHQEVLEAGAASSRRFEALVRAFVRTLPT
jgi:purine-nucleoside phosphorylase